MVRDRRVISPGSRRWETALLCSVGFRVLSTVGEVGRVEAVRLDPATAEPMGLVVGFGRAGTILVPVGDIELVRPAEATVVLGSRSMRLVSMREQAVGPGVSWEPAA